MPEGMAKGVVTAVSAAAGMEPGPSAISVPRSVRQRCLPLIRPLKIWRSRAGSEAKSVRYSRRDLVRRIRMWEFNTTLRKGPSALFRFSVRKKLRLRKREIEHNHYYLFQINSHDDKKYVGGATLKITSNDGTEMELTTDEIGYAYFLTKEMHTYDIAGESVPDGYVLDKLEPETIGPQSGYVYVRLKAK